MTPTEYRAAIAALGLSQGGAARALGVDARTSRRWALGEQEPPIPVQRLLWACERDPSLLADLAGRLG